MAIKNQLQFRRGSSTEWVAISGGDGPTLYAGEPGFDSTNNILKIGDGSTSWKDLKAIGADQNLYKVKNTSGGIIYKGQVVRANGTVGNSDAIQITLFIADGSVPEYTVMGLATQDMNNNDFGYVTAFGQIIGIDTDPDNLSTNICAAGENWLDGDVLYASPSVAGKLTKNKPQHDTIVAIVLHSANNGSLFARPSWNPHLDDLHDVNTSGVSNNQYLRYDSASDTWLPTSSGIFTTVAIGSNIIPEIPIASLYVKGNIHTSGNGFFGTFNTNEYVTLGGFTGGDVGLVDYEDSPIAVKQGDGIYKYNIITIDDNNVGIGTSAPSAKLDVDGDILSEEINIVSSVNGATLFNIEGTNGNLFSVVDSVSGSLMSVNDITGLPAFEVFSDHSVVAGRFNANDFVISSDGNIGIGIAAPSGKLHVVGDTYAQGSIYISNTSPIGALTYNRIYSGTSDNFIIQGGGNTLTLSGQGGSIDMRAYSTSFTIGNSYNAGTTNQFIRFMPANSEAMRITNAGNVGIGTNTPASKLDVAGVATVGYQPDNDICFSVVNDSPVSNFNVRGGGDIYTAGDLDVRGSAVFNEAGANVDFRVEGDTDANLLFLDASSDRVGIGTSTPSTKLHVNGSALIGKTFFSDTVYHYSNGILIATDIATTDNFMCNLTIEGHSYDTTKGPIFSRVQFYNYVTSGTIINTSAISTDKDFTIDVFHYNGYVYLWFAQTTSFQSYTFKLNTMNSGKTITAITNAIKPTSGVTNSVTITPHKIWNAANDGASSGLDADLLDGNHASAFQLALTNPVTGTGAANHIAYWSSASGIAHDSNELVWDSTNNRLGIRTSAPSTTVDISGVIRSFATSFAIAIDGANGSGPRISIGSSSDYTAYMDIGAYSNINNVNTKGRDFRLHSTTIDPILYAEYDTGNIGIGTSSPSYKLHLQDGNLGMFNTSGGANSITFGSSTNSGRMRIEKESTSHDMILKSINGGINESLRILYSNGNVVFNENGDNIDFRVEGDTDANLLFVDASTDRVGIGTSAPSSKLMILTPDNYTGQVLKLQTKAENTYSLYAEANSPAGGVVTWSWNQLNAGTTYANVLAFDRGNVGIGTSTPSVKFHVVGTHFNDGNIQAIGTQRKITLGNDQGIEDPGSADLILRTGGGEKIRILNASGNVGIGTTTPSNKLNVNTSTDSSNGLQIVNNSAGTSARSLLSLSNGSYGAEISLGGTGTPNNGFYRQNRLLISGPFITDYVTGQHVFSIGGGGSAQDVAGSTMVGIWDLDSLKVFNSVAGGTSATAGLRLKSTTANGTTDHISFLVGNNGGTEALRVINNGNVGIGTTTPEYKLQVNGSFGATTKSFRIDHPSRPNYTLEYGSLESPYHGVRLTGRGKVVKGSGTVLLPSYLKDLIHDDENINIQITNIKHGKTIYVDEIDLNNDQFTVRVDRAKSLGDLEFFWVFTGIRKDVDNLVVEREK